MRFDPIRSAGGCTGERGRARRGRRQERGASTAGRADEGPCNSSRRFHQSRTARWLGPTRAGATQVGSSGVRTWPHKTAGCIPVLGWLGHSGLAHHVATESTLTLTLPQCEYSDYPPELCSTGTNPSRSMCRCQSYLLQMSMQAAACQAPCDDGSPPSKAGRHVADAVCHGRVSLCGRWFRANLKPLFDVMALSLTMLVAGAAMVVIAPTSTPAGIPPIADLLTDARIRAHTSACRAAPR